MKDYKPKRNSSHYQSQSDRDIVLSAAVTVGMTFLAGCMCGASVAMMVMQ
jgi:hypothetical protein